MNFSDDNPPNPPEENLPEQPSSGKPAESASAETLAQPLAGDPLSYVPVTPAASLPPPNLPEDLRISWSWPHLLVFVIFVVASQIVLGIVVIAYYSADRHLSQKQLKHLLESDPRLIIGTNVLWFALIFLFLYVTLAVLRDSPFWRSLGWKKLKSDPVESKGRPWMYFLAGCGLSIFVAIASSRVKDADHVPIQEFFKNRTGALSLMAMAVLVAPLVEETVFRGYLYPVLARITSGVLQFFGMEFSSATRAGVATSILMTGTLAHSRWRYLYLRPCVDRHRAREFPSSPRLQFHDCLHFDHRDQGFQPHATGPLNRTWIDSSSPSTFATMNSSARLFL